MDTSTKLAQVEASLKRWHTRLARASGMVAKLEKRRRRLAQMVPALVEFEEDPAVVIVKKPEPSAPTQPEVPPAMVIAEVIAAGVARQEEDPLKVPAFLKRDPNADALKAMNRRIEERAANRKAKPVKKATGILAKAIAENEARNK